ncbi:MAG: RHS repeat-associated core domain-containing protein, partial [Ruminococcus sp.]|nr:RHS repeat-associated core domain-containing protein [Ruminococcus sp.]
GYVYDDETGLYYLNSRYYDPETGRFINADIYCDTMSNILGTNMFTYCNNNPVNQIDPEGTDAVWLQFGTGVQIANYIAGHTSLLLEDATGCWWYFYWGDTKVILRPCGTEDFTLTELSSYLSGFDPRKGHNYYVKAYNTYFNSKTADFNKEYYKLIGNKKIKINPNDIDNTLCNDGVITHSLYFDGDFTESLKYIYKLSAEIIQEIKPDEYIETLNEGGKQIKVLYLKDNPKYHFGFLNCVQVSIFALVQGTFDVNDGWCKHLLMNQIGLVSPNRIYNNIYLFFLEGASNIYEDIN